MAETKIVAQPPRVLAFDVEPGGSKTLAKNDVLWTIPLRWPKAAILDQSIQVAADDRRANLNAGDAIFLLLRLSFVIRHSSVVI